MRRSISQFYFLILLLIVAPAFAQQSESVPASVPQKGNDINDTANVYRSVDIEELVHEAQIRGGAAHRHLIDYTYQLKKTRRILNEQGKITEELTQEFEAYPVSGEHALIQLTHNGKPLADWQIDSDRRRAGERLLQYEREKAAQAENKEKPANEDRYIAAGIYGRSPIKYVILSIDPTAFLESCEFTNLHTDKVNDREMIVLDFRPRSGVTLPAKKAYLTRLTGSIWIDAEDKMLAKLEAHAPAEAGKVGAMILYEQKRIADGIWFPAVIRLNAAGDGITFDSLNWDVIFEFNGYKQFKTSADEVNVTEPKKPN